MPNTSHLEPDLPMIKRLQRNASLIALFVIALPLFCWLQWQPKAWLDNKLADSGLATRITYAEAKKDFPGLKMQKVRITLPDGKQLDLADILLRPSLAGMLRGRPALFTRAHAEGMSGELVLAPHDDLLDLGEVSIDTDSSKLARFDSRLLLLGLHGNLSLHGHLALAASSGLPQDGDIRIQWDKPVSTLLPGGLTSISLKLGSKTNSGSPTIWQWKLTSKPQQIAGQGQIVANGSDIRQWLLQGHLRTARDAPEMTLTGSIGLPRLH